MWGEQFTARLNMNLREEKGWTYGARSGVTDTLLPGVWSAGASVRADASDDAVLEILRELRESLGPRPFTEDELRYARTGLLGSWPLAFERPGHLLGEQAEVWRYQLPADWISGTPARVSAVSLADAQAAWARQLRPDSLLIVIVGDADEVEPGLRAAGLPVIRVDADGNPSP
jgi:zinc protease